MIKINPRHIGDQALPFNGMEPKEMLDLQPAQGAPPLEPASDVSYHLLGTKTGQDLLVTGSASFLLDSVCARCMKPVRILVKAEKICLYLEKVPEQEIDITPQIREELLLNIPEYIHCSPACKGLCSVCGANLNDGPCGCSEKEDMETPEKDSPWKKLDFWKP